MLKENMTEILAIANFEGCLKYCLSPVFVKEHAGLDRNGVLLDTYTSTQAMYKFRNAIIAHLKKVKFSMASVRRTPTNILKTGLKFLFVGLPIHGHTALSYNIFPNSCYQDKILFLS